MLYIAKLALNNVLCPDQHHEKAADIAVKAEQCHSDNTFQFIKLFSQQNCIAQLDYPPSPGAN